MHAEVVAIGDEITSGQLLDTNTATIRLSGRHSSKRAGSRGAIMEKSMPR